MQDEQRLSFPDDNKILKFIQFGKRGKRITNARQIGWLGEHYVFKQIAINIYEFDCVNGITIESPEAIVFEVEDSAPVPYIRIEKTPYRSPYDIALQGVEIDSTTPLFSVSVSKSSINQSYAEVKSTTNSKLTHARISDNQKKCWEAYGPEQYKIVSVVGIFDAPYIDTVLDRISLTPKGGYIKFN